MGLLGTAGVRLVAVAENRARMLSTWQLETEPVKAISNLLWRISCWFLSGVSCRILGNGAGWRVLWYLSESMNMTVKLLVVLLGLW